MPPSSSFQSSENIEANPEIVFPEHLAFFLEQNRNKSGAISSFLKLVLRVYVVRISEEDDDFPSKESVTSQSKIDTIYQSKTDKGIRKICFELLDLKDAVENLCGLCEDLPYTAANLAAHCSSDMTLKLREEKSCIHTFLGHTDTVRGLAVMPGLGILSASHDGLSDEVFETKHELNELQKNISSQGILVQDLLSGVCQELEEWSRVSVAWAFQEALAESGSTSLPARPAEEMQGRRRL